MNLVHYLSQSIWTVIIGVLAVARATRFVTYDDFPPMEWVRVRAYAKSPQTWQKVWVCGFCMAPYLAAIDIAWYFALHGHGQWFEWGWLLPNAWAALAYAAAIVCAYDQPDE